MFFKMLIGIMLFYFFYKIMISGYEERLLEKEAENIILKSKYKELQRQFDEEKRLLEETLAVWRSK